MMSTTTFVQRLAVAAWATFVLAGMGGNTAHARQQRPASNRPLVVDMTPRTARQGQSLDLVLRGSGLRDGLHVALGEGISADATHNTDTGQGSTRLYVRIAPDAPIGRRQLVLIDETGARIPQHALLEVEPGSTAPSPTPQAAVARVTPDHWATGRDYALRITGTGLSPGAQFDFGPGVQALSAATPVAGGDLALRVRVASGAAPGRRIVGFELPPSPNAMLALPAIKGQGPAAIVIEATPAPAPPVRAAPAAPAELVSVQPVRVRAGSQVQLVFVGQGLQAGVRIDYGAGIRLQGLRPLDDHRFAALARIDAGTPPGARAPRVFHVTGAPVRVRPGATLHVIGAPGAGARTTGIVPQPPLVSRVSSLRVESVYPGRVAGGKAYTVMVRGQGFTTRMQLDLGSGIAVDAVEVVDARQARVRLSVASGAAAGMRFARARLDARQPWSPQPARVLIEQPVILARVPSPKWAAPKFSFILGKIELVGPSWWSRMEGSELVHVPTLQDAVTFQWRERNPGLAEWFEVRFYRGDKLVATREVGKRALVVRGQRTLPTFLAPDPALVAELGEFRNLMIPTLPTLREVGYAAAGAGASHARPQRPASDLTWEVVGYRTYYRDGVHDEANAGSPASGPAAQRAGASANMKVNAQAHVPVTQEVERSDRWPLNSPALPTGMACQNQVGSKLQVMNIDAATGKKSKGGFSTSIATAGHTGDRWKMTGSFSLGRSPWASQGSLEFNNPWKFDNVFIDWGDGTVQPLVMLNLENTGPGVLFQTPRYQQGDAIHLDQAQNASYFQHAYHEVGQYNVRVYQLAEDDLQGNSAAAVSLGVNPGGSFYAVVTRIAGGTPDSGGDQPRGFRQGSAAADRAYMVYCNVVDIQPRSDDATNGPLNLVAAKLRGFPEAPGDATPPPGVKVAPAPGNTPRGELLRASNAVLHASPAAAGLAPRGGLPRTIGAQARVARVQPRSASRLAGAQPPTFSACDVDLTGGGYLYYFGTGKVRTTWYVDGTQVNSTIEFLEPSWPRPDAQLARSDPGDPLIRASDLLLSPAIPLKPIGGHTLHFESEVVRENFGLVALDALVRRAVGSSARKPDALLASQLAAGLRNAPPIGVLPPVGVKLGAGGQPVVWLQQPLRELAAAMNQRSWLASAGQQYAIGAGQAPARMLQLNPVMASLSRTAPRHEPPEWAGSNRLRYQVTNAHDGIACTFEFPVEGGSFTVSGLQDPASGKSRVKEAGGRWSGTGDFNLLLPNGSKVKVPVQFHDWRLASDGITVEQGAFEVANPFSSQLKLPAASARLTRLGGTAGKAVTLDLVATLANPNILVSGTTHGPSPLTVKEAVVTPQGDVFADKLALPDLNVYDSGFHLTGIAAVLDWSASAGAACDMGNDWKGIAFTSAVMDAYNFDLKNKPTDPVQGWGIDVAGFCGSHDFGSFAANVQRGSIRWDGIQARAGKGTFTARYQGLRAHVPWLDVDLTAKSATALRAGAGTQGGGKISLNLEGDAPLRDFGAVSFDADGLALGSMEGVGLAVQAQTTRFSFRADGQVFANDIAVAELTFGMDGKAYFREGGGSAHADLGGSKGRLSQGVIDLKGMTVTATGSATQRLRFAFAGDLTISDALPAADAPVTFRIDESSAGKYVGSGPVTGKFVIHKPFPDAHPSTDTVITPTYVGPMDGSLADAAPTRSLLDYVIRPAYAATAHMTYCGDADLGMFGGPPVKGGFALGYQGGDSFWAASANVSLGPTGTPLVTPFLHLYEIGGGLGYNVAIDSFAAGNSCAVRARIDHTPVFDAHLVVGDPSHFAYGLDGHFTVKVTGAEAGARMTYKAWMLRRDWSGEGDLHGYFQYANGNFDGNMNGRYSFLNDAVYIEAENNAIALHFGDGDWFVHAGTRENPVKGHMYFINAGAWAGVGSTGLYAGAHGHFGINVGDCGAVCASVNNDALIEAAITPAPHLAADATIHMQVRACAFDICLGGGQDAGVHLAALPPELAVSYRLESCPPGYLEVGLQILPSPKPRIGGGLCVW